MSEKRWGRPRGTPTTMLALRVRLETPELLTRLAEKKGVAKGIILDEAIARLAKQNKIKGSDK